MRQTHVITPVFHILFLRQVGIIHSEAAEGGVVCSAEMGQLDSLLLEDPLSLLLVFSVKGQTPALASHGAGFALGCLSSPHCRGWR